jgi:hypothetical protein
MKGIEPSSSGWKPEALPLSYIRIILVTENRFELVSLAWKAKAQPLYHTRVIVIYIFRHIRPAKLDGQLSSLTAVLVCIPLYAVPGIIPYSVV